MRYGPAGVIIGTIARAISNALGGGSGSRTPPPPGAFPPTYPDGWPTDVPRPVPMPNDNPTDEGDDGVPDIENIKFECALWWEGLERIKNQLTNGNSCPSGEELNELNKKIDDFNNSWCSELLNKKINKPGPR